MEKIGLRYLGIWTNLNRVFQRAWFLITKNVFWYLYGHYNDNDSEFD